MRNTVAILGIPIDDLDTAGALDRIDAFVQARRFHQVATANTDFLIKAQADPELKTILRTADLVVPDGMPIVWASRWLKVGLAERVTGADLVPLLAARAAERGYSIFMLGGEPDAAAAAQERLQREHPTLRIVGRESPMIPNLITCDHAPLLDRIRAAAPDILLVAFGNPKQEKWIHMHRRHLQVPACIGVGGTFDFLSGKTKRAPKLVQRMGLEFAHRWREDPKRLGPRYRNNLAHFPRLIIQQVRFMRRGDRGPAAQIEETRAAECTVVSITGALGLRGLARFQEHAEHALDEGTHLVVDLTHAARIDSAVLGTMLNLVKRATWADREVRLVGPNRLLRRVLAIADAESQFRTYRTVDEALAGAGAEPFEVRVERATDGVRVALAGRADVDRCDEVFAALAQADCGQCPATVDLQAVTYADCAMLSALYRFAENRVNAGTTVRFLPSVTVAGALAREKLDGLVRK